MEQLTRKELSDAQAETLAAPRQRPGIAAWLLFLTMDVLYGRKRTLRLAQIGERQPEDDLLRLALRTR